MASSAIKRFTRTMKERRFLFQQLIHRDFQKRYKGTSLGMMWSVLSPLCHLAVMMLVFSRLFGRNIDHFVIYVFAGNIVFSYFRESTKNGMTSLLSNSKIILKINIPKYLFLLSQNVSALINFVLTIAIFFVFCIGDHVPFTPKMLLLLYSVFFFVIMNVGIGMVLSALYVFFRDVKYLYDIFLQLLHYLCAIFYSVDRFPEVFQQLMLLNPVYAHIKYWRLIVLEQTIPSAGFHLLLALYAIVFLLLGVLIYRRLNHRFVYYF